MLEFIYFALALSLGSPFDLLPKPLIFIFSPVYYFRSCDCILKVLRFPVWSLGRSSLGVTLCVYNIARGLRFFKLGSCIK